MMDVRPTRLDGPHRLSREGDPGVVDIVVSSVDLLAKEECYEFCSTLSEEAVIPITICFISDYKNVERRRNKLRLVGC